MKELFMANYDHLKKFIRDVPDFPKPGIIFKDITPLLAASGAFQAGEPGASPGRAIGPRAME